MKNKIIGYCQFQEAFDQFQNVGFPERHFAILHNRHDPLLQQDKLEHQQESLVKESWSMSHSNNKTDSNLKPTHDFTDSSNDESDVDPGSPGKVQLVAEGWRSDKVIQILNREKIKTFEIWSSLVSIVKDPATFSR